MINENEPNFGKHLTLSKNLTNLCQSQDPIHRLIDSLSSLA